RHIVMQHVERVADVFVQSACVVIDVDPNESTESNLRAYLAQAGVGLAEALLKSLFLARYVDAVPLRVERPGVEDTRDAFRIADGIVEQCVPAMRTDVIETPHLFVFTTDNNQRCSARVTESTVIKCVRNLRLVAGDDPALVE